jgi:tetratricopeptide (TPR) repeat protein
MNQPEQLEQAEGLRQAAMHLVLGSQLEVAGRWEEAEARYQEALRLAEQAASPIDQAPALLALGVLQHKRGAYEAGLARLAQARQLYESLGDRRGLSRTLVWIGTLARQHGYYETDGGTMRAAYQALQQGFALARELGDSETQILALHSLAHLYQYTGQLEESLVVQRQLGNKRGMAALLLRLGMKAEGQHDYPAAQAHYQESLTLSRESGDKLSTAHALAKLGEVAWIERDYGLARQHLAESFGLYQELGETQGEARLRLLLGHLLLEQGEWLAARARFAESITQAQPEGDPLRAGEGAAHLAEGLVGLAAIAARRGPDGMPSVAGAQRAASLLAAAVAALIRAGVLQQRPVEPRAPTVGVHLYELPMPIRGLLPTPTGYRLYERTLVAIRAVLDAASLAAAWQAGASMSQDEATTAGLAEQAEQLAAQPAPTTLDQQQLLQALRALRDGNFAVRLPGGQPGVAGEIAATFNELLDLLNGFVPEATRVCREIGTEGYLGCQAETPGMKGGWLALNTDLNRMAANLTNQLRDVSQVVSMLNEGDTSRIATALAQGEMLLLQTILNRLVARLADEG